MAKQLTKKGVHAHQLCEIASFYDVSVLQDQELLLVVLDRVPEQIRQRFHATLRSILEERGGLASLVDIDVTELAEALEDQHVAARLKALIELARRLTKPREIRRKIISADDAVAFVRADIMYLAHEEMVCLYLDTKNCIVHRATLSRGTVNSAVFRVAEILRPAVIRNCPNVIVCHNHPSGDPAPSAEDIEMTKQLVNAGTLLDIKVLDHLIIGNPCYVSLKQKMAW